MSKEKNVAQMYKRRIAILYPVNFLDSVPCVFNMVIMLARQGYFVDVFIIESDDTNNDVRFNEPNVVVHVLRSKHKRCLLWRHIPNLLIFSGWALNLCRGKKFLCFIGVDPSGLVAVSVLGVAFAKPRVYFSLELIISSDPHRMYRGYKHLENWCSRHSSLVIIQDEKRAQLMSENNHLPMSRFVYLPNSPIGPSLHKKTYYLHKQFGLSHDAKILLCAGTLSGPFLSEELAHAAIDFPNDWKLVFQSRRNINRKEACFCNLSREGKIYLSDRAVSYSELDDLIRSADIGIALYDLRSQSPNVFFMGKSSGKLSQYLKCGLPVIVTRMPGWDEMLVRYHAGILVNSANDVKAAAERIFANYEYFSSGAIDLFENELNFEIAFEKVISRLDALGSSKT